MGTKFSILLELAFYVLAIGSEEVELEAVELFEGMINGPLVFLKIEGDKHFFPPSYSFIS